MEKRDENPKKTNPELHLKFPLPARRNGRVFFRHSWFGGAVTFTGKRARRIYFCEEDWEKLEDDWNPAAHILVNIVAHFPAPKGYLSTFRKRDYALVDGEHLPTQRGTDLEVIEHCVLHVLNKPLEILGRRPILPTSGCVVNVKKNKTVSRKPGIYVDVIQTERATLAHPLFVAGGEEI
jgi:hypothetical protein